jgi:hypothetical protein
MRFRKANNSGNGLCEGESGSCEHSGWSKYDYNRIFEQSVAEKGEDGDEDQKYTHTQKNPSVDFF